MTHILVAGAGAIGQWLGARLQQAGEEVTLLCRPSHADAIAEPPGLSISGQTTFHETIPCITDPAEAPPGASNAIFLTCKAYDTTLLSATVAPLLSVNGWICSLQNGLGNGEKLVEVFGQRVAVALTSHGITLDKPGALRHTGTGPTVVGGLSSPAAGHAAEALLAEAGLEPRTSDAIEGEAWAKAIVNAGINPVGATARVPNGHILEDPALRDRALRLAAEAETVARAAGVALPDRDFQQAVLDTLAATAKNRCSMLQDVLRGKRTEINEITGHIVAVAKEHGVAVPESKGVLSSLGP